MKRMKPISANPPPTLWTSDVDDRRRCEACQGNGRQPRQPGSQAAGATKSNKKEKQLLLLPSERRKPFRKSERQSRQGLSLSASILQTTAYLSPSFRGHPWGPWPRSHSSKLLTISSSRWMIAPCDSITWLNVPIAELVVPMADVTVALNSVADWTNAVVLVASFSTIPSSRSKVSSSRVSLSSMVISPSLRAPRA